MKDSILYEIWVVWMNDDFFWASQCLTFQRYINWVLQNFLDKFCSVYVNDILISLMSLCINTEIT
jgi:hypothetical protein